MDRSREKGAPGVVDRLGIRGFNWAAFFRVRGHQHGVVYTYLVQLHGQLWSSLDQIELMNAVADLNRTVNH